MEKKSVLKKVKILGICLTISFLFLIVCSKSSFLYPLNDWVDANCFFTMGKGLMQGNVLYVDLFDQKGPLLFFYYGLASLISYQDFLGVFFIEVISFTAFLYYAYQLLRIYLKKGTAIFCLPVISFLILTLPAFTHGGSAEEFCLPFLMYGLYSLVRFLKSKKTYPSRKMLITNGICAGMVAMIKFSMLGFWFGLMFGLFLYLLLQKEWKQAIISSLLFLLGMLIPILPWLIYFISHHALNTFIDSYILFNVIYYPHPLPLFLKPFILIGKPLYFISQNLGFGIFFLIGTCSLFFDKILLKKRIHKWMLALTFLFLCMGVFFGGIAFRYYYLILSPFLIFGLIVVATWIEKLYSLDFEKNTHGIFLIFTTLLVGLSFFGTKNTGMMKPVMMKEDTVQYQFAAYMNQKENPTLLNYQFLDGGFYTASGIVPNIRYFQKQNISDTIFTENTREQNEVIRKKQVDFVVTRTPVDKKEKRNTYYLKKNYKKVLSKKQNYEERRYQYTLWQKK